MNFSQLYCYDFDRPGEYFRLAATHNGGGIRLRGGMRGPGRGTATLASGYYVARLTVLAHLVGLGRQAGVLAVRVDRGELRGSAGGVGGARGGEKDHGATPQRFGSQAEAMTEMEKRIRTPAGQWRREAWLLLLL